MGVFSNTTQPGGHRWFAWLSLLGLGLGLALLTGVLLWRSVETSSVVEVQDQVEALKPVLSGLRIMAIALTATLWSKLVNWLHRQRWFEPGIYDQLQALRWRVVTWLVIIELVLGHNLPGQFITILQESAA